MRKRFIDPIRHASCLGNMRCYMSGPSKRSEFLETLTRPKSFPPCSSFNDSLLGCSWSHHFCNPCPINRVLSGELLELFWNLSLRIPFGDFLSCCYAKYTSSTIGIWKLPCASRHSESLSTLNIARAIHSHPPENVTLKPRIAYSTKPKWRPHISSTKLDLTHRTNFKNSEVRG